MECRRVRPESGLGGANAYSDIYKSMNPIHWSLKVVALNKYTSNEAVRFMCLSKEVISFRKLRKTDMVQLLYVRKNEIGSRSGRRPAQSPTEIIIWTKWLSSCWKAIILEFWGCWEDTEKHTYSESFASNWWMIWGEKCIFFTALLSSSLKKQCLRRGLSGPGSRVCHCRLRVRGGFRLTAQLCPDGSGQPRWASQTLNCELKANRVHHPTLRAGSPIPVASVR